MLIRNVLSADQIAEIATAYQKGEDQTETLIASGFRQVWLNFVRDMRDHEHKTYWPNVRIIHVDHDPYTSADEMRVDMVNNGQLLITVANNNSLLNGKSGNIIFREAHDMQHAREAECGFFLDGEVCAFVKTARCVLDVNHPLYARYNHCARVLIAIAYSEIVGQVASLRVNGTFPEQKIILDLPNANNLILRYALLENWVIKF